MKKNYKNRFESSGIRRRSVEELRALLSKYEAILASVPDIIMEIDADRICTWVNQAGFDFFGEDILGRDASPFFEGEQSTGGRVQSPLEGDEDVFYVESRQRRRDGEKRLLAWRCRMLKDSDGNMKGAVSAARDITEKGLIEEQIRRQVQLFSKTIDSLPHPFYVIDANDYTIKVANSAASVFGNISEDTTCHALTHKVGRPCRGPKHTCTLEEVKKTKKPVLVEHVHYDRDGNARYVEVHGYPVFDDRGNVVQMIEYGLDVTERKRAEEKLRESKERFQSVVRSAHDAIISIDGRGKIFFWNRAAEKIFGYTSDEMAGRPVSIIMPERFRERHRKGVGRVISTGKSRIIGHTIEVAGLKKDGSEFPLELSLAKWRAQEEIFFTGILRDITERKQAEAELQTANERMRNDLEAAAETQKSLLPEERLDIQNVRFASAFEPCEELGGDIFNVFRLDEKHVGLYILDVSGHGVPAALLSVTLSHFISPQPGRSSLLKQEIGGSREYRLVRPAEVAGQLNRQFLMDPGKLQYFTLVYGILDMDTHEFRYVSAGHPALIYLARGSEPVVLKERGFPIGWFEESDYEEYSVCMKPGDRLYLYSDGITDATNSKDEQFGEGPLVGVLDRNRRRELGDSISSLLGSLEEWRGGARLEDDVSILAVEIAGKAAGHTP